MKLYNSDGSDLMTITTIGRVGNNLVITGNIFGTMPVNAQLRPKEARAAFKLLTIRKLLFLVSLLWRDFGEPG